MFWKGKGTMVGSPKLSPAFAPGSIGTDRCTPSNRLNINTWVRRRRSNPNLFNDVNKASCPSSRLPCFVRSATVLNGLCRKLLSAPFMPLLSSRTIIIPSRWKPYAGGVHMHKHAGTTPYVARAQMRFMTLLGFREKRVSVLFVFNARYQSGRIN